jgi:nucleotide-binding universal stress UspA family protein
MTYKRILVAIDGSETSTLALTHAYELAKSLKARLCILHVYYETPPFDSDLIVIENYQQIVEENASLILTKASELVPKKGLIVDTQLVAISDASIRISEKIIGVAKFWLADLLVIGTHGRRGFNRLFLGSVAEEVIKISDIPILLIRSKPSN